MCFFSSTFTFYLLLLSIDIIWTGNGTFFFSGKAQSLTRSTPRIIWGTLSELNVLKSQPYTAVHTNHSIWMRSLNCWFHILYFMTSNFLFFRHGYREKNEPPQFLSNASPIFHNISPVFSQRFPDFSLTKFFKVPKCKRCRSLNLRLFFDMKNKISFHQIS